MVVFDNSVSSLLGGSASSIARSYFKQGLPFFFICCFVAFEYVRPQSIYPALSIIPWSEVFLGFGFISLAISSERFWVNNRANKWLLIYLVLVVASPLHAEYPEIAKQSRFDYIVYMLTYFAVLMMVRTKAQFLLVILLFVVASFKLSQHGAITWALRGFSFTNWGLAGPPGPFQNSGEFSIQMLMFAPFALELSILFKSSNRMVFSYIFHVVSLTAVMSVLGASSRGSQLGLLIQIGIRFTKLRFSSILISAILLGGAFLLLPEAQKERFQNIGSDRSSQQRILYWTRGVEIYQKFPILGLGLNNFPRYFAENYPQDMLYRQAQLPHNIFIQVATDTGTLGLITFAFLIFSGFRNCKNVAEIAPKTSSPAFYQSFARACQVGFVGFLIAGQFVTVAYYPFFWVNLAFSAILWNLAQGELKPVSNKLTV